jgi:hypothetical protein
VTDFKQRIGECGAIAIFDENVSFVVGLAR